MQKVKVSIIIPCFNHGPFLQEAIDSSAWNKNDFCEVIVINDGSTDKKTLDELKIIEKQGVKVIHQENKGPAAARNTGIKNSQGEYLLFLDADNIVSPEYYLKAIQIFEKDPAISIIYSDAFHFGIIEKTLVSTPDFSPERLLASNFIDACAVVRKSAFDTIGGFDEEMPFYGNEDWEFWIRCWSNNLNFQHIPEALYQYRVADESTITKANQAENRKKLVNYILEKYKDEYSKNVKGILNYYLEFLIHKEEVLKNEIEVQKILNERIELSEKHIANISEDLESKNAKLKSISEELDFKSKTLEIKSKDLEEIAKNLGIKNDELRAALTENHQIHLENGKLNASLVESKTVIKTKDDLIEKKNELIEVKTEECNQLENQNKKALVSIFNLQTRINNIEASKAYKLYKHVRHFKNRFKSNYSGNTNSNIFKKIIFMFGRKGRSILNKFLSKIFKHLYLWFEEKEVYIVESTQGLKNVFSDPYHRWLDQHLPTETKIIAYKKEIDSFKKQPKFSVVMPVYNPQASHFKAAIDSVVNQVYQNWELCLADDCSTDPEVKKTIHSYIKKDPRIKAVFRKENGHISAASNSALEITTGDYIVLMDQDDIITVDALYHNARIINAHEKVDLIYSDEDKIDDNGVHSVPHFKPNWSPDNLLSRNYLGHLTVFNAEIMKRIGGWRIGFEGSQDYDLVLRFTEETDAIYHIPLVLYHWRIHAASAAGGEDAKPYAYIAAKKAITEALIRRKETGTVDFLDGFRGYSIRYDLKEKDAKVSIIIPTKDKTSVLKKCVDSIFEKSTYSNFEVIVIDNNSEEKAFFNYMKSCEEKFGKRFKCIRAEIPFNFSKLVNLGVKNSTGEYALLLNNDTEVISNDWIEGMLEQAQRPSIGVVGVKLLYPNMTIQHAGVVMGLGGAAGHVLVGEDRFGPGYFNYVNMINNYSAVTAACIMVRKDIYNKVGGFDEAFTIEYNDVDFCLKVRELGLNNVYLPHVELIHYESISRGHPHMTKESYERHVREIGLLKGKWMNYIDDDPCYNPNLTLGAHDFSIRS